MSGSGGAAGLAGGLSEHLLPSGAKAAVERTPKTPASPETSTATYQPALSRSNTSGRAEEALSSKHRQVLIERARSARLTVRSRFEEGSKRTSLHFWLILMSTAVLSSLLSYSIDQATWSMGVIRHKFTTLGNVDDLTVVICFNVLLACAARLIVRTTVEAEGSGFPEVKAMLFGKVMTSYLTLRVLAVKAVALALGVGAGLPLGKEGPNVHMAACISRTLGPNFYERKPGQRTVAGTHLLLAACAVGVGSSFSAPIGGVVFSLELVLPQVFDYIGYTGCFLSAVTGSVCFAAYRTWTAGAMSFMPLLSTNVKPNEGALSEYPSAMVLFDICFGVLCGVLGGTWIRMHARVVAAMKRWRISTPQSRKSKVMQRQLSEDVSHLLQRDLLGESPRRGVIRAVTQAVTSRASCQWRDLFQITVVVILNTVGAASLPLLGGRPQPALLSYIFNKDLTENEHEWVHPSIGAEGTVFLCFLFKWTLTIFALSLPNPAGVVAPTMIIGGLLGRCLGMAIPNWLVERLLLVPGETEVSADAKGAFMARLAILGAAAFCAAVCRAFAMAITVFEVLALPNALLPLCSSSLAAMFVANKIALPYFDTNLVGRGLGGISALTHTRKAQDPAFTVMRRVDTRTDCLEERTTVCRLRAMLELTSESHVPVVQNVVRHWADEGVVGLLKGSIARQDLARLVRRHMHDDADVEVDLLSPDVTKPSGGQEPLVECVPAQVTPGVLVQDVYLIMKITGAEVVYVTRENCLVGVINFKELLGHHLNE